MNKKTTIISSVCAVLLTGMSFAQFTETMGTATPNTETVNAREAGNRFAVTALTYSGVNSDVRITSPSHLPPVLPATTPAGYAGASGGHCVLLQPGNETFEIHTIDASTCPSATLSFGVNKTTNASNGSELDVDYSTDGGATWVPLSFTALPTGSNTSGSGTSAAWYLRTVTLPTSANIWVRFTNTQAGGSGDNPQFRIDDVSVSCGSTIDCSTFTASVAAASATTFCAGSSSVTLESTTNIGSPLYQWYNLNDASPISGATTADLTDLEASGTYYVKVSDGAGCTVTSNAVRVLVYPAPQLCDATVEGCAGDTVEFCPELRTEDLIFSQYMEGSGFNKCIEIYNGTCEPRNSGDYELRMYVNGSATGTLIPTNSPNVVIMPGETYVICHDQADSAHLADKTTSLLAHNGNESFTLFNTTGGVMADIFGVPGFNPGSSWRDTVNGSPTENYSTEDLTLVRKPCVYSGITVNPALPGIYGFSTLFTEWDTLPKNSTAGFGSHVFTGAPYTFGGDADIASETSTCVEVVIGREATTLEVFPTLCDFNNCGPVLVAVVDTCNAEARSMSAPVEGSVLKLQAFPNPTADATTIVFNQEKDGNATITMTDLAGHVVLAQTVQTTAGEQRIELNLAGLASGTYVCNVATANAFETVRIVKSK